MSWFCCCRRQRKDAERQPLLQDSRQEASPSAHFDHFAESLGALKAGKLPSSSQLSNIIQLVLRSKLLGYSRFKYDFKEILNTLLSFVLEKNDDDRIQQLLWFIFQQQDKVEVHSQVFVDGSPPDIDQAKVKDDVEQFLGSLKSLCKLTLTSSAFRLLVSELVATTRQTISEVALHIGHVAATVQSAANSVAGTVQPEETALPTFTQRAGDPADHVRTIIIGRVQELIYRVRQDPQYKTAIQTIFSLCRKYCDVLISSHDIDAHVELSPEVYSAIFNIKILLERIASHHSLDPLLHALNASVIHFLDAQHGEIPQYLAAVHSWFNHALDSPHFATSRLGTRTAEQLFDTGRALLTSEANAQWAKDLRLLVIETQSFLQALESDKTTQRLVSSLQTFSAIFKGLVSMTRAQVQQDAFLTNILTWLIPSLLGSIHLLPMPHIEVQTDIFDLALDSFLLSTSSPMPADQIRIANSNEVVVDMTGNTHLTSSSRIKARIEGLCFSVRGLGWYLRYKGAFTYTDEGSLDIHVGEGTTKGMVINLELNTRQEESSGSLFRLADATIQVPRLSIAIRHSKHWLINALLVQPLAPSLIRFFLQRTFRQKIEQAVEGTNRLLSAVIDEASRIGGAREPGIQEYWNAMMTTLPNREESVPVQSRLQTTMQGLIYSTTDAAESTTTVAAGIGPQLFPDYAENHVGAVVEALEAGAANVTEEVIRTREVSERSAALTAKRERFERGRNGWRSTAFDFL
ncbi:hypothetical protein MIND_01373000 [Mycena indigotica]|uniref:HAM1-like N-terminal domain-containing protein n=1 Tax=Mycena indigotica TaxID=2126181 RepID=A0A8H6S163_9AGAR|nr:uncharacterized protein MIND_01373000 [Mycena indigotica]KAF7289977.1 hypothetical protein MIND_01373000 [Mycena indigotica]